MIPKEMLSGFKTDPFNNSFGWILCFLSLFFAWFSCIRVNSVSMFVRLRIGECNLTDVKCRKLWWEFLFYFPRRRCREDRASSSRLWDMSQMGVSGMKIIPASNINGKMVNMRARIHQSTKAPMMYATRIPRAKALAVRELRVPRIWGEEHSLICNQLNCVTNDYDL